jgi:hypothetical protein
MEVDEDSVNILLPIIFLMPFLVLRKKVVDWVGSDGFE